VQLTREGCILIAADFDYLPWSIVIAVLPTGLGGVKRMQAYLSWHFLL